MSVSEIDVSIRKAQTKPEWVMNTGNTGDFKDEKQTNTETSRMETTTLKFSVKSVSLMGV